MELEGVGHVAEVDSGGLFLLGDVGGEGGGCEPGLCFWLSHQT